MNVAPGRLREFEILRTVSILLLLVHHSGFYALEFSGFSPAVFSSYFEAFLLGCFFLISGYFTERSLQKVDGNLLFFFRSKFIKIYPPYHLACILYMFILGYTIKKKFDLVVYLVGAQFIFSPSYVKPILTLWYISAILLYFVIFASLWKVTHTTKGLVMGSVLIFIIAYVFHYFTNLIDVRFFEYYFVFLTGIVLARLDLPDKILSSEWMWGKITFVIFGVGLFSLAVSKKVDPFSPLYITASYFFIVSSVIILYAMAAKFSRRSLWAWVIAVSYASFFIYLFHRPFWQILEELAAIQEPQNQILFRLIPASIVVIVACYFLQRFYDFVLGMFHTQNSRAGTKI